MMEKYRHFHAVLLMLLMGSALLLSSCQQGQDDYDATPQANLDALWQIIDQHYCFISYKEQQLGISWEQIHQRYSDRLNPAMTKQQLFEVLSQMLGELQDGHVDLYTSADIGRYWSWHEDYPENLDRELRDDYLGTDYKIASGLKYKILDDNIGYVVYESFQDALGNGNLDDVLYYLRLCDGLILDIRGNTGGDLTNVEKLSRRFTNEKVLVGYSCYKTGTGHNDFSTPEAEYIEPSTGVRWQKKVVLLTNRSCFSAANAFVRNMKEMPLVTVMGDRTGGGSGLPFSSELPIGWAVRFSACPSYDARMNQTEFGIEPDVSCSLDSTLAAQGRDSMIEQARNYLH